jgi:uncharacterized surface protein with fasciclin (FAS1) repeats
MTDSDPNLSGAAGSATPGGSPLPPPTEAMPVMPSPEETLLPQPWYKKPLGIGMLVVGALLLAGLIFGLVWAGGDDDAEVVAARVVFLPKDSTGAGLDRPFFADVIGTSEFPSSFVWLEPGTFPGPEGIGGSSAGSGRMEFAWAPAADVVEPEIWTSTITIVGSSPAGFAPPGPVVECVLSRPEQQNTTVSMDVVVDPPDPSVEQEVTYTFTNHEFLPDDSVTCEVVSLELPPETTTTVPETTVPETTVPETTVPETTVPATTPPATTPPETTVAPPTAPATAGEALLAAGDYGTFLNLASTVPSVQALLDGKAPITVFAPNDAAFAVDAPPTDAAELEQLLLSHIVEVDALDAASLFDGSRTEVATASGGTQPIVQDPATVGGATVVEPDLASTSAVSHGIDTVLSTTP